MATLAETRVRVARDILGTALVYAAVGLVVLLSAQYVGLAAPLWPAAGVAFALVYQRGYELAIGVFIGSFAVNSVTLALAHVPTASLVITACIIAAGASAGACAGTWLVRRFLGRRLRLLHGPEILWFLVLAGPVACLVAPTLGVLAQLWQGLVIPQDALLGWLTWWVGDAIGVIIFGPVALMLLPEQADLWRGRRWRVAVPSVLVTLLLVAAFMQNLALEQRRLEMQGQQIANEAVSTVRSALGERDAVLSGVRSFFEASQEVSTQEFATFTAEALAQHPSLQAVSWNAYVPADVLASYESSRRAEGQPGFTVTEKDAEGNFAPVGARSDYVVVTYIEPMAANAKAVGYDIGSNPVRREALEKAIDFGSEVATAPVDLVQETEQQKGILTLLPIYATADVPGTVAERRDEIRGFAVTVTRLGTLLDLTFLDPRWANVTISLTDVTDAGAPIPIATHGPAATADTSLHAPTNRAAFTSTLDVDSRTWQVDVTPGSDAVNDPTRTYAPFLLVFGMLLLGLLEATLLLITGTERQARRDAEEYSYEASHDALTDLLNRRAFLRALGTVQHRQREDGTQDVLLFMDLDGFKQVNDSGGHEAGDRLLVAVARALRNALRSRDVLARMGGDEFAAIINGVPERQVEAIGQTLVNAVRSVELQARGRTFTVGVSIGATVIDEGDGVDIDALLRRADAACYAAKHANGSRIVISERTVTRVAE